MSNDGGKTYPYGFFLTGDLIAKILYAHGINADYIDTGALTVRDSDGNIIFQVDMDTKKVIISGDNVVIGDSSLPDKLANMDNNIADAKNMTFQLSNDMQTITSDADGNIPVFPTVATTAKVMYGSSDITNNCSYTITKSDSVTGSWDVDTHTYTVAGLSADNGWVDIKATYLINLSITKRFTISKQKQGKQGMQGVPGRTYFIELTSDVVKRGADKVISPSTVQAFAYYRDGDGATRTAYSGLWKVQLSTDGKTWIDTTTISKPTTNIAVQLSDVTITEDKNYVKFVLYAADGFTNLLDSQTVPILTDVSSLTQQEIVEILSNNGDWNGLYYLDGRLYVSFDAALGGTLKIGGAKNANGVIEVTDGKGNVAVRLDQNGMNAIAGKFSGELNGATGKFSGTLESVDGTFTGILNGATGTFTGKVGSYNNNGEFSQLDAGCVEVGTIEDGEITGYLSTSEFKDTGNWGMRVAGRGVVAFSTPYILVGDYKEYNEDFVGSIGQSGTCKVITEISTTGSSSGLIINSLKTKTVTFEKGLMVTAI